MKENNQETDVDSKADSQEGASQQTEQKQQLAMRQDAVFGEASGREFHNFVGNQQQQFKLLSLATGPSCGNADNAIADGIIPLRFYYAHVVSIEQQGGEVAEVTRCVLITKDLKAYAFVSDGIRNDLRRIIGIFGVGPYDPPLQLKIVPQKTRAGMRIYSIVPA